MRRALIVLLFAATPLAAQSRDSLIAGRRAYERAELPEATRLLPIGLAGANVRDTLWATGAHMLLDALLEQTRDSLASLWARWALRLEPGLRVDSNVFPPRVARTFALARAEVGERVLDSTAAAQVSFEPWGDGQGVRGQLRFARGSNADFAAIESVGTLLRGEARSMPPGTITVRFGGATVAPSITLELPPGVLATVTSRPPAAMAARAPAPRAEPAMGVRGPVVAAAAHTTCAVLPAGPAACWGDNRTGQLGGGFADSARGMVIGEREFAAISVGGSHACGLTRRGIAWCWGLGVNGQLGTGPQHVAVPGVAPTMVAGGRVFELLASGSDHTCALTTAGAAFCWGANGAGQLGNRSDGVSPIPAPVSMPPGVTFTALAAGEAHTCALAPNGAAWCWGANDNGQLGNGGTGSSNQPVLVQAAVPFRELVAGNSHSCALSATGSAFCWGGNASGQLGDGTGQAAAARPSPVAGNLTFTGIASGDWHNCGLAADGAVYCWGAGRAGQLGNGQSSDSPRPVLVVGGHTFRTLGLGELHACATTSSAAIWCWGDNTFGQLGALGGRASTLPVPVILRPAPSPPPAAATRLLYETFDDGNYTSGPAWLADSARGAQIAVVEAAATVTRTGSRGVVTAAGLSTGVRISVRRETAIQFDVRVDSVAPRGGCGVNCAAWPAVVRVRATNSDLTESEAWFAFGTSGGQGGSLGGVTIVARGDAVPGQWLRRQRFTIRDALPRAETITQISIGGVGTEFAARFDNISLPAGSPASIVVRPDTLLLGPAGDTAQLSASVKDSAGIALPWIGVAWRSNDTLVARVDSLGRVTSGRAGRALLRASAGTLTATVVVLVRGARPGPTLRPARP